MELDLGADMEVDKVADKTKINININMEIQFGEGPEAYPACASSKLCEFSLL